MIGTDIEVARAYLLRNEVVAIPTETVYGLAGNALNEEAVSKIFEAKNRPQFDPLIVHIADISKMKQYAKDIPPLAEKLAKQFWPGPLTILLKKKKNIPDLVTSGLEEVGLRVPNQETTLALLRSLPFPLAAPSANPFGYISPTTAVHVEKQLGDAIAYVLDDGPTDIGVESTVIRVEGNTIYVLRLGGLSVEELEPFADEVIISTHSSSSPAAPGMLTSHYAPRKRIEVGIISELLKEHEGRNCGVLSFQNNYEVANQRILSPSGSTHEAAVHFFRYLRELDESEADIILCEFLPEEQLGRAINDKLLRATAK